MKFKPIYLYGIIAIAAIAALIIVAINENSNSVETSSMMNNEQMPDDDVHKQLMNQGSNTPGKQNVSEEYKRKMAELENAINENPSDTIALRQYADYLTASHKMNEAIPYYNKIIEINPRRADIHFSLAIIYFNKQDFAKCQEENEKVLEFEPKNQMALYNLGAIEATKGNNVKAKEYWNKLISIDSESETANLAKESLSKL
jgi:tetratricopeptide (TPR) repeat protein